MLSKFWNNFMKKSLKERFLLFIGMLFFLCYFILGCMIMFIKSIPLNIPQKWRYVLGIVLIIYSFIRFLRLMKSNNDE